MNAYNLVFIGSEEVCSINVLPLEEKCKNKAEILKWLR